MVLITEHPDESQLFTSPTVGTVDAVKLDPVLTKFLHKAATSEAEA
jgi:hypothetical protein